MEYSFFILYGVFFVLSGVFFILYGVFFILYGVFFILSGAGVFFILYGVFFILYGVFVQSFELVAFSSMGLINRLNPHTPYRAKAPPTRAPYGHGSVDNKDYS